MGLAIASFCRQTRTTLATAYLCRSPSVSSGSGEKSMGALKGRHQIQAVQGFRAAPLGLFVPVPCAILWSALRASGSAEPTPRHKLTKANGRAMRVARQREGDTSLCAYCGCERYCTAQWNVIRTGMTFRSLFP